MRTVMQALGLLRARPTLVESLHFHHKFKVVIHYPTGVIATEEFSEVAENAEFAQQYAMLESIRTRGAIGQEVIGVVQQEN